MINISVNDQPTQLQQALPLNEFLTSWETAGADDPQQSFAVAINGEFIPRTQYATTVLQDGDTLDIVSPVGGG